jgi:hypothetical protein
VTASTVIVPSILRNSCGLQKYGKDPRLLKVYEKTVFELVEGVKQGPRTGPTSRVARHRMDSVIPDPPHRVTLLDCERRRRESVGVSDLNVECSPMQGDDSNKINANNGLSMNLKSLRMSEAPSGEKRPSVVKHAFGQNLFHRKPPTVNTGQWPSRRGSLSVEQKQTRTVRNIPLQRGALGFRRA